MSSILLLFLLPLLVAGQTYPPQVQKALQSTANRGELERALQYCYQSKDPLKIKSINFLVANLPIHSSQTYYWADEKGKRIAYDELSYGSFKEAVAAFNSLKIQYGKIHPVPYSYRDIDSITAAMLIENVESAQKTYTARFGAVSSADKEKDFLEYVLPYRTSVEPLQNWRKLYSDKFSTLVSGKLSDKSQMAEIGKNIKSWFTNTYKTENNRSEPLPRLGAVQLLTRRKGACEDLADLAVFIARSQGLPAAVDFIPAWATASGIHFLTYMHITGKDKPHFDAGDGVMMDSLAREPAKVFRTTYSIQPGTVAYQLHNDTANLPPNFLRFQNYIDVTHEYWQTADVHAKLFKPKTGTPAFAYLSVWNFSKWRMVWYGKIENGATTFTNMCKGAVYLPVYYINGRAGTAGWPVVNGEQGNLVLQPDMEKKRTVHIKEQAGYLAFRPGKRYRLMYWNNAWLKVGEQVPNDHTTELVFENIPSNALLLLVPEYTEHKERPFMIDDNGNRSWF